jgi:predicted ATP-grasp superfamily ATP-dependent carboligase
MVQRIGKSFKMPVFSSIFGEETLRLLVYEHVSGGGFAEEPISSGVLSEGFGMLRTLISDFKAGGHYVTTLLDSQLARLNPPIHADCVVPVFSSREAKEAIRKISESADATYIIAPETDQILQSLVESIEQTGAASLNCPSSIIEKVANKAVLHKTLRKLGLPSPETIMFSVLDNVTEIKATINGRLNFPLIFKPLNGVSCCGLSVVRHEDQVAGAVGKIIRESSSKHFMAQELIKGTAASVCLISTGGEALSISLNKQYVTIGAPEAISSYDGGLVPFDNPLKPEAFVIAEKIVKSFRDLRGFVGVDLVLTEKEIVTVEINPRLTTSYVGLRQVANFNPAQAIINAVLKRELPTNIQSCGYAYFSKVETPNPTINALQKTYKMNELVSPPFPVSGNGTACALISSHSATLKETMLRFREAKKRFLSIISRGK